MYHLFNTNDTFEEFKMDFENQKLTYTDQDLERFSTIFEPVKEKIQNSRVLDLGSNLGYTCMFSRHLGASTVIGLEARQDWIDIGNQVIDNSPFKNIIFVKQDITHLPTLEYYCKQVDLIICVGVLYHLNNHFEFLQTLCKQNNVKTIVFESLLFDNESIDINWILEPTIDPLNAIGNNNQQLVGAPNLKWIETALDLIGWEITYSEKILHKNWNPKRFVIVAERKS